LASLNETTYQWEEPFLRRVLGLWIHDKDFLPSYRQACDPLYFEVEPLRHVAHGILNHFDENYAPPPQSSLKHRLEFFKPQVNPQKTNSPEVRKLVQILYDQKIVDEVAASRTQLEDQCKKFALFQSWKYALYQSTQLLPKMELDEARRIIFEADNVIVDMSDEGRDLHENVDNLLAWAKRKELGRISCGMPLLDAQMGGGMAEGEVIVLAGGTNVGKTTGGVVWGYGALVTGARVLHIANEAQREEIEIKYVARMTGVPINTIADNCDEVRQKMKEFKEQYDYYLHTKYYTQHKHTIVEAYNYFLKLKRQKNWHPDLVVIDNPDLFKPQRNYRERSDREIQENYSYICGWARKHRVPILLTSDVQKEHGEKKRITRFMGGGSYAKGKYVDIYVGIGADEKMRALDTNGGYIELWVNFDKVRNSGPGQTILVRFYPQIAMWEPLRFIPASEFNERKGG
jgi:archaellum biogenesis ATPase FlaH